MEEIPESIVKLKGSTWFEGQTTLTQEPLLKTKLYFKQDHKYPKF